MNKIRIALAQINTAVGDFDGNVKKIIDYINRAKTQKTHIVVFPEMSITGYPPEDLVMRTDFINKNLQCLSVIAEASQDISVVVGFIERDTQIYNAAAFIYDGRVYGTYRKIFLPNYGVFDEKRNFSSGTEIPVFDYGSTVLGVNICEDIWYPDGPMASQAVAGAGIILNLNSSPYQQGKWKFRERMISTRAADNAAYVIYVNSVGGQDELVFEGGSMVFDPLGEMIARGKFFEEDLIVVDIEPEHPFRTRLHDLRIRERMSIKNEALPNPRYTIPLRKSAENHSLSPVVNIVRPGPEPMEEVYNTLVLGTHDYVTKNGFKKVMLGLSGGIDSALAAAIAVDALGAENVEGVFMPSRHTSTHSREDAFQLANNLGMPIKEISIEPVYSQFLESLAPYFGRTTQDNTEQNLQARIRGMILMALSNKFGALVLTTGNKSEMSVGYATLYGDMAGGFAVIKDIPKTLVYKLSRYRNKDEDVIPERIFTKPPSAELKDNQKDEDNLPPYDILDPILKGLIEEDRDIYDISSEGFDAETVRQTAKMVLLSEYKRRQAPPGIKITPRAFGRDRRIPITNRFTS